MSYYIVILVLIIIFISLFSALFFMLRNQGKGTQTVKALSWRIALSLALFLFLFFAFYMGWIQPHGVGG